MPINNETLVALPLNISNEAELRIFLVKLMVALDSILGLRGDDTPLVTKEFLAAELAKPVELPAKLEVYSQTMAATYDVIQMQTLSDAVTRVTDKVNELL